MQGCPRIITNIVGFILLMIAFTSANAQSDIYLQQLTTIPVLRDSTRISSITPIGDFNADGWGDLAVGITAISFSSAYDALNIYYGGPAFDSIPDICLIGDPQNMNICGIPTDQATAFGNAVTPLGDFNGDGYDDFAVSAFALCTNNYHKGRIYIYLGGPNPDTIPDVKIDGIRGYDGMGRLLASGNFNGDSFGDLIALAGDPYYGERINIFYGGNPPDTTLDWVQSYPSGATSFADLIAGFDPNYDGCDDFFWIDQATGNTPYLFFGGGLISHQKVPLSGSYAFYNFDLSGDGVDDFARYISGIGNFLCLGGAPFDTIPDYQLGWRGSYAFLYNWPGHENKLVWDDANNRRLVMFSLNIPPDIIPYAYIPYGFVRFNSNPDIGDINGDGTAEIALGDNSLQGVHINIYTIATTGIADNEILPSQPGLLSAYPNPFNSSTTMSLSESKDVQIMIFDILGKRIAALHANQGQAVWDASAYSSGIYFARVAGEDISRSIKLVLLK
jgi:hypothetical protein